MDHRVIVTNFARHGMWLVRRTPKNDGKNAARALFGSAAKIGRTPKGRSLWLAEGVCLVTCEGTEGAIILAVLRTDQGAGSLVEAAETAADEAAACSGERRDAFRQRATKEAA